MNYYLVSAEETLRELRSSENGLSHEEAEKRLKANGKNKLDDAKKESLAKKFLAQIADPMIIMLLIAAGISAVTSYFENESFADVFIILFVVIFNSVLGIIQESKAEKAIDALKEMTAATSKVIRDSEIQIIKSEDLVAGDIVVLEAGDSVPADGRVIETASLKAEEAALTGESVPVSKLADALYLRKGSKDISLGDRKNMMFMGSVVSYGRGRMVVTNTGMQTEVGKIAEALQMAEEGLTPLQKTLAQLGKTLSKLVLVICAVVFAVTLFRAGSYDLAAVLRTFMIAVALAVAAIPEGLPAVVTIVLSIGVTNMSKRNAVIRKLMAVETLGSTQVICSDKTGTLTQNKMTVVEHYGDDEELLACSMSLCSDARIRDGIEFGDPTEVALIVYAGTKGFPKEQLDAEYPRSGEAPFDSNRKMMSTVHETENGYVQYTKGAPDILISNCTKILEGGKETDLTEEKKAKILSENKRFADRALRVLAAAYRRYDEEPSDYEAEQLEHDMVFIGLAGMMDPCREEVYDAITKCREAGILPVMITGDHKDTAVAIASELKMIDSPDEAITGEQLEEMSDEDLARDIAKYHVYARVQPEHKVRIVKAWQSHDMVSAMTGDGVNDAPSIKTADIGVGMGITGTDVTKNVADMVLADDNFATIVSAIEEGRKVYDNLRKVLLFLLSANLSEVLAVFFASLAGFRIFEPVHLLWVNLITDAAPALALGMEAAEYDLMSRKPRASNTGILTGYYSDIILHGVFITLIITATFFIGHYIEHGVFSIEDSADGTTMAFIALSMTEIFHSFNMRSQRKSLFSLKTRNKYLYGSLLISALLSTVVIYVPFLSEMFGFASISAAEFAIAVGMSLMIFPLVEITKAVQRKLEK